MTENPKKSCFVIGPIGDPNTPTRNRADTLLEYVIKPALEPMGYEVIRADKEDSPGMIGDRVITRTIESDLVVADLTDQNPNAFYELAIRHMEEKPVVHMILEGQDAPFDVQQHHYVAYRLDNPADHMAARKLLKRCVESTEGKDFKVSNPVTMARGHAELKQSADPKDEIVAELAERLTRLHERLHRVELSVEIIPDEILEMLGGPPTFVDVPKLLGRTKKYRYPPDDDNKD